MFIMTIIYNACKRMKKKKEKKEEDNLVKENKLERERTRSI